ncbi:MAG TPA: hypothetical protein VEC39_16855 [Vicinamibacterales bacterium]|nr:hypothetical protein [Vicinamibacterales bacterium]
MRLTCIALLLLVAAPASAQVQRAERLPWFVADAHAATVGLPQAEGWVPAQLPATTELPGRYWGVAGGATVYPVRLGKFTLGLGASIITGKGKAETLEIVGSGPTATSRVVNVVRTGMTSLVPQISVNFGHRLGWSYMSAGIGRSKVTSRADATRTTPEIVAPEAWNQALNFGGGARWFMKPRLGAGFDVRFIKLSSRSPTEMLPSAKRTQVWNISAGISIQ